MSVTASVCLAHPGMHAAWMDLRAFALRNAIHPLPVFAATTEQARGDRRSRALPVRVRSAALHAMPAGPAAFRLLLPVRSIGSHQNGRSADAIDCGRASHTAKAGDSLSTDHPNALGRKRARLRHGRGIRMAVAGHARQVSTRPVRPVSPAVNYRERSGMKMGPTSPRLMQRRLSLAVADNATHSHRILLRRRATQAPCQIPWPGAPAAALRKRA